LAKFDETRKEFYVDVRANGLKDVCAAIKRMRYHAGMNQTEYAEFVGVNLKTLRNAEQGMDVSVATLNKIGKPFRLKVGFLVDE
jgi:DNA-binding XRE family transcriptional regulator